MTKRMRIFCVLILLILIPGAICVSRGLPPQTNVLIAEKYAGWSGVLRVWLCEGWAAGRSIAGWINTSAAVFERTHDGVFIQVTIVDSETLARLPESGLNLPDLILFPTGALNAETPLDPESPVRPIALGGYLWAINRTLIDRVPADLSKTPVGLPMDTPENCYSAALLALCSGSSPESGAQSSGGMDLGLDSSATPSPVESSPRCTLPENLTAAADAFDRFISGQLALIPVSLNDISRLERLSERGKAPDWQVLAPGNLAFTDQALYLAVPESNSDRLPLARAFAKQLLEGEAQSALGKRGLIPVCDVPLGLPSTDPLCILAKSLYTSCVYLPDAFSSIPSNVPIIPNIAEQTFANISGIREWVHE